MQDEVAVKLRHGNSGVRVCVDLRVAGEARRGRGREG
jgi:hypothetical protein